MADSKDVLKSRIAIVKADMDEAKNSLGRDLTVIYADPIKAARAMTSHYKDYGEKALLTKLDKDPAYFGAKNGHLGSGSFWGGAGKRAHANETAESLGAKVKSFIELEKKLEALQMAFHGPDGGPGGGGRSRGLGGPDL